MEGKMLEDLEEDVRNINLVLKSMADRSQWPRGLRHELSSLARKLGSWVRIPLKAWMSVCTFILCLCRSVCR
jgi:hypothetical protein